MPANKNNREYVTTVTLDDWQTVALKVLVEHCIEGKPMPNIHKESLQATLDRLEQGNRYNNYFTINPVTGAPMP